jgi:hypothetical protein
MACDLCWRGVYHGNTHPHVIAPTSSLLTCRKNRKTKPILHPESVGEYWSEARKATYGGLEITPVEVLSVFFSASAISPVAPIEVCLPPLPTLIRQHEYAERTELWGHWFRGDMDAVLEERIVRAAGEDPSAGPPSWYKSLSGVVVSMIHQFIMMHQGYHTAGGRKDSYDFDEKASTKAHFDTTNVAKLMMRISQIPPGAGFPVHAYDFPQWRRHFETLSTDGDYGIAEEYIIVNKMDRARTAEYRDLASGHLDSYMEEGEMDDALNVGKEEAERLGDNIDNLLTAAGVEREYFNPHDFLFAHSYPVAPLHDPEWQPWLAAMASTNIYGQLSIMYRRICAVQTGTNVVAAAMMRRAQALEEEKKFILQRAEEVRNAFRTIKNTERNITSTKHEISALQNEIAAAMEVPGVQRALALSGDLGGERSMSDRLALYVIAPLSADCQG